MNVISHNLSAMFTSRQLGINTNNKAKSVEKLSSGYRINRSADDAAGLSISEKMRRQIRGLKQGAENMQDGVSFCQTADGYLEEVVSMLQRMNELSVKAANGTNSASDRADIDNEMQELKTETNRIFSTAKFNETDIFKVPYVPAPIIREDDMKVFSSGLDNAGNVKYGGIEVNDVRHTWEELGIELSGDGKSFASDKVVTFNDSTGELIELHVKAGDPLSNVTRRNYWDADEKGVYINEVFAQTWDEIGIKESDNKGEYVIRFKGQEICFEVNDGDSRGEVEQAISADNLNTEYSWDLITSDIESGSAVTWMGSNSINVTNNNKDDLDSVFKVKVYDDGVTVTKDGSDLSKTAWESLAGGGDKPISDWGLTNNGLSSNLKTIDSSATYTYTNTSQSDLKIQFSFSLAEESGLDEVTAALDGVTLNKRFDAMNALVSTGVGAGSASNPAVSIRTTNTANNLSYEIQKAYNRDFNDPNDDMTGSVVMKFNDNSGYTESPVGSTAPVVNDRNDNNQPVSYVYYQEGGKFYKVEKLVNNYSEKATKTVTTRENHTGYYSYESPEFNGINLNNISNTNNVDYYIDRKDVFEGTRSGTETTYGNRTEVNYSDIDPSESILTELKNTDTSSDWTWNSTPKSTSYGQKTKTNTVNNTLTLTSDKGKIGTMTVNDTGTSVGDTTLTYTFRASGFATCSFTPAGPNIAGNKNNEIKMRDVKINVPLKELDIQTQAANPDYIAVQWSGLNNGILGIQTINTKTIEEARFSIDQVSAAIKKASDTRSTFGAQQNRLEHAIRLNNNTMENTQAAESIIRDTDMAKEMVKNAKESILEQVGQAMLTQANALPQSILTLLG